MDNEPINGKILQAEVPKERVELKPQEQVDLKPPSVLKTFDVDKARKLAGARTSDQIERERLMHNSIFNNTNVGIMKQD